MGKRLRVAGTHGLTAERPRRRTQNEPVAHFPRHGAQTSDT